MSRMTILMQDDPACSQPETTAAIMTANTKNTNDQTLHHHNTWTRSDKPGWWTLIRWSEFMWLMKKLAVRAIRFYQHSGFRLR